MKEGLDAIRSLAEKFLERISKEDLIELRSSLLVLQQAIGQVVDRINKVVGDQGNVDEAWGKSISKLDGLEKSVKDTQIQKVDGVQY